MGFAGQAERQAAKVPDKAEPGVRVVFDFVLRPTAGSES
jgi:hypothetical protein